jgi:hypothetical protein
MFLLNFKYPQLGNNDFKPQLLNNCLTFNGIYEVATVKHNFSDGVFKQTLHAIRMVQLDPDAAFTNDPNGINSDGASAPVAQNAPSGTSGAPSGGITPNTAAGAGSANPSDPRGIRNNNPTNLSYVAGQPKVAGSDGRFGVYPTMQDGVAAATNQLVINQQTHGFTTVAQQINSWAPPNENSTSAYVNFVSQKMGVGPNDPIDVTNPATAQSMVSAMIVKENGKAIDPSIVQAGVAQRLGS